MTIGRMVWLMLGLLCTACQPSTSTPQNSTAMPVSDNKASATLPPQCDTIALQMNAITANSDVQSLAVVNQALRRCVPLVDEHTRWQWLDDSWDMYQRFLDVKANADQRAVWDEFSSLLDGYPEESSDERQARLQRQAQLWPQLSPRMQHMAGWIGKQYIDNFYVGNGVMRLRRHPHYLVDVFAPVLPEAERTFINELAQQNSRLATNDTVLVLSWPELARRSLFWERYQQQFPHSRYSRQAAYLFKWNQALLYNGLPHTPLINLNADKRHFDQQALQTHRQLAQQTDSALAAKSQALLAWYERYDNTPQKHTAAERKQAQQALNALRQQYQLTFPATKERGLACHSDAVCH